MSRGFACIVIRTHAPPLSGVEIRYPRCRRCAEEGAFLHSERIGRPRADAAHGAGIVGLPLCATRDERSGDQLACMSRNRLRSSGLGALDASVNTGGWQAVALKRLAASSLDSSLRWKNHFVRTDADRVLYLTFSRVPRKDQGTSASEAALPSVQGR